MGAELLLGRDPRGIPTSLTSALLLLEHALTAAEVSREQVVEISIALRDETSAKHDLQREVRRLRRENDELRDLLTLSRACRADEQPGRAETPCESGGTILKFEAGR